MSEAASEYDVTTRSRMMKPASHDRVRQVDEAQPELSQQQRAAARITSWTFSPMR